MQRGKLLAVRGNRYSGIVAQVVRKPLDLSLRIGLQPNLRVLLVSLGVHQKSILVGKPGSAKGVGKRQNRRRAALSGTDNDGGTASFRIDRRGNPLPISRPRRQFVGPELAELCSYRVADHALVGSVTVRHQQLRSLRH